MKDKLSYCVVEADRVYPKQYMAVATNGYNVLLSTHCRDSYLEARQELDSLVEAYAKGCSLYYFAGMKTVEEYCRNGIEG